MKKVLVYTLVCLLIWSCLPAQAVSYRVSPSKSSVTLAPGETEQLSCKISPSNLVNHTVTWSSDNSYVASVDKNGKVLAKAAGSTYIRATIETGDSCRITVKVSGNPVTRLTLSETTVEMEVGQTHTLTYILNDTADDKRVKWSSEDTSVAKVDSNGCVKAVGGGVTTITLTCVNGMTDTCIVYVPSDVNKIELVPAESHVGIGSSMELDAYVYPGNARDRSLTWESSDETVAVVDPDGRVTGLKEGSCLIRAMGVNGVYGLSHVYVSSLPETLSLSGNCVVLSKSSRTRQLTYEVTPESAASCHIDWSSSDESVVTVENGLITARGYGSCVVSASALNGVGAGVTVYVCETPESVRFTSDSYSIPMGGEGVKVNVRFEPEGSMLEHYTVITDDESIARVSPDGTLEAVSYGSCSLRLTSEAGLSCSAAVRVYENASALYVSETVVEIGQYEFHPITVFSETGKPYLSDLNWTSADESVCVYTSDGCLYGKHPGSTRITFSSPGTSLTCQVYVTVVASERPAGDLIALTFDNGPDKYTDEILTVLDKYGIPATFFLLGENVDKNKTVMAALGASVHELGNHTWNNSSVASDPLEETAANLEKTDRAVKKQAGREPTVLRAPDAMLPSALFGSLIDTRRFISRGTDMEDVSAGSAEEICRRARESRTSACILTFHDCGPYTAEALDHLLGEWLRDGCRFVTVSEMMEILGAGNGVFGASK